MTVTRDYSVTVRLSPEERAALEALAQRFDLDKSATVRHALQLTLKDDKVALPQSGQFVPIPTASTTFPVRLCGKDSDA